MSIELHPCGLPKFGGDDAVVSIIAFGSILLLGSKSDPNMIAMGQGCPKLLDLWCIVYPYFNLIMHYFSSQIRTAYPKETACPCWPRWPKVRIRLQGDSGGLGLGYININSISFRGYPETELSQHNPIRDHQNHPVENAVHNVLFTWDIADVLISSHLEHRDWY